MEKKKVGIITIHHSTNYGACLQSWALYKFLKDEGYDCEVIDLHRPVHPDYIQSKKYRPFREKETTLSNYGKFKQSVKRMLKLNKKDMQRKVERMRSFSPINDQIKMSRTFTSIDLLYENPPVYDIYITGSDQLWNPTQPFCIEPYFLTFVKKGQSKKISYASSIGISELHEDEKDAFHRWLKSYDAISVREEDARKLICSIVDKPVEVVADPTFLMPETYWHSIAKLPNEHKYILVFMLSANEIVDYGIQLGKESGLRVIVLPSGNFKKGCTVEANVGLYEYLGYFASAEMVISDSFHAMVFSILMGAKNFYAYIAPTNKRGSRIRTLFDSVGINEHILQAPLDVSYKELQSKPINSSVVRHLVAVQREKAQNFLRHNLNL